MEVHHHGHHPKKWKEYFTEFIMLFLAVSMGFIAENIRDKYVEKERAEEFIQSFVSDIKANQKLLDSLITRNTKIEYYFDSMSINHSLVVEPINLYELSKTLDFWVYRFVNRKTTFEQMKSSGSLRYIQNKEILNAILEYEDHANMTEYRSMQTETQYSTDQFRPALMNILPSSFFIIRRFGMVEPSDTISLSDKKIYYQYINSKESLIKDLSNTKLSIPQIRSLSRLWYHRMEKINVSLFAQKDIRKEGDELISLIENHK